MKGSGIFGLVIVYLLLGSLCFAGGGQEAETSTAEPGEPQYGGTINFFDYFSNRDMATWDINADNNYTAMKLGGVIYERLMAVNYSKGRTGTGEFEFTGRLQSFEHMEGGDGLAESWELVDPTTVVFRIRPGIMWPAKRGLLETPRELTAEDVAFVYNTALKEPKVTQQTKAGLVEAIAVDKYTLQLKLRYFWSDWAYDLVFNKRLIYSPEAYEAGLADWRNCHGTGAYQVMDFVPGTAIYCDKNPTYWIDDYVMPNGKEYQLPFADEFVMLIMPDEATQIAALRTGKIDVHVKIGAEYNDTLAETSPDLRHWNYDSYGGYQVGMKVNEEPFDDIRVRRAMSMAIDRQMIVDELMGGNAEILNVPIPRAWGKSVYTPIDQLPTQVQEDLSYNPQKARELLKEAGYPNGFSTSCIVENSAAEIDLVSLCADFWSQIGVDVAVEPVDSTTFSSRTHGGHFTGMAARGDSSPTYKGAFDAYYVVGGEVLSTSRLNDAKLNDMIDRAIRETDTAKANQLFKEANVYALELCPYVNLPQPGFRVYAWPWIRNYEGEQMITYHSGARAMQYAWVDQAMKKKMGY